MSRGLGDVYKRQFQLNVYNAFSFSSVGVGCRLMFMHKEEPKETEEEAA